MFSFRNAAKILLALVLVALATPGVLAQTPNNKYQPDEFEFGIDIANFQISDTKTADWPSELKLFELFNQYFAGVLPQDQVLTSSQQIFESYTVIVSDTWTALEGAQVFSAYKLAGFWHDLKLESEENSYSWFLPGNTQDSAVNEYLLGNQPFDLAPGEYRMELQTDWGTVRPQGAEFDNGESDGYIHMFAIDVTALMQALLGNSDIQSAYMFCWEDMDVRRDLCDFDYQDLAYIMINVRHESDPYGPNPTPEPATALILLAGLVACPLARKLRKK